MIKDFLRRLTGTEKIAISILAISFLRYTLAPGISFILSASSDITLLTMHEPTGEVGLILENMLPRVDLLLAAIILNGIKFMIEEQQPG